MEKIGTRIKIVRSTNSYEFEGEINNNLERLEKTGKFIVSIETALSKSKYGDTYMATIKYIK